MTEIWLTIFTLRDLVDEKFWTFLLPRVEKCINKKFSHIDENDPIRRKVSNHAKNANYICNFQPKELGHAVHCKFRESKIEATISLYKEPIKTERRFVNEISFFFPKNYSDNPEGLNVLINLFSLLNEHLDPIYSYCDIVEEISSKRKATGWPVDFESELAGIFWLTFLMEKYVEFFGLEKVCKLNQYKIMNKPYGRTFRFGKTPGSAESILLRGEAQKIIGEASFVNPESEFDKPPGINMPLYSQLNKSD